ncbi:AAA family ATPase [Labrys okinawensis]|uniref:tyrosine-protein kinase domain-containing protein n=1 Tax=Labrys okinawensis TaxID=346911 RepID=UPI0039BD413F
MLYLRPLNDQPNRFSPRDVIVEVLRYGWGLVLWFIFCMALAIGYLVYTPPEFYASTNVILQPRSSFSTVQGTDPSLLQVNLDNSQVESQIQIVKSERVLRYVFQTLNLQNDPEFVGKPITDPDPTGELARRRTEAAFQSFSDRVTVRRIGQSLVLEIGFRSRSSARAASIANSITASFMREQILGKAVSLQSSNDWLQVRKDEVNAQQKAVEDAVRTGDLGQQQFSASDSRIISGAIEPLAKTYPQTKLILALAFALALLTGLGMIGVLHSLDRTLRAKRHVQRDLGLNCLGIVPMATDSREGGLLSFLINLPRSALHSLRSLWPFRSDEQGESSEDFLSYSTSRAGTVSPFAESLRAVRTAIMGREVSSGPRLIGMVSCLPSEGKTTIASNLAHLFAASGRHTMLVDGDLRNSTLTRHYAPNAKYGLSDVLQHSESQITVSDVNIAPRLDFIPAMGSGRSTDINLFIGSSAMQGELRVMKAYDYVVVDLPAMSTSSDVKALVPLLDAVVFIIEAGKTTSDDVTEALETLQQANGKVLGAILNKVPKRDWPTLLRRPRQ